MKTSFSILLSLICAIGIMTGCTNNGAQDEPSTNLENDAADNGVNTNNRTAARNADMDTNGAPDLRGFLDEAVNIHPFDKADTLDLTKAENAQKLGLRAEDIEEGYIERTSDTARADEIIVVKAKAGKAEAVKAALEKYGENKHQTFTEDMKDLLDISDKREISMHGDYVVMITSPKVTDIRDLFDRSFNQ